ncbi:hypothetical protein ACLMJK_009513 [Lecanora helva]
MTPSISPHRQYVGLLGALGQKGSDTPLQSQTHNQSSGYQSPPKILQDRTPTRRLPPHRLSFVKALPAPPEEIDRLDHRIGSSGGTTSSLELLPHRLKLHKETRDRTPAERIEELQRQNGFLFAEVALLKETRRALRELQAQTEEAFQILQKALSEVKKRLAGSESRLMEYWGIHTEDGSEEIDAF